MCVCFIGAALVDVCCSFSPTAPARPPRTLQIIAPLSALLSRRLTLSQLCSKKLTVISKIVSGLQLKSLAGHLHVSNGVITEVARQPAANR